MISAFNFIETIADVFNISPNQVALTPYRSGLPVDKIPKGAPPYEPENILTIRRIIGSLMWLAQSTRPDIATFTYMLALYQTVPTPSHIDAAKRVLTYLLHTKNKGISFHETSNNEITTFINFPLQTSNWTAMSDANWGPQDQSRPHPSTTENYTS